MSRVMKKIVVALLLCLAGLHAQAQTLPAGAAGRPVAAAASPQEEGEDSSTAEDLGRVIGVWMKRATEMLKDLARGVSEGFRSTPQEAPADEECSAAEARAGKCKPAPENPEKTREEASSSESPGLFIRLLKALF